MSHPRTAIVIGAGVVGVSSAYALARRGVEVTLVDRREGPAMEASHANGAQLSYLYTDALANPALLSQLPKLAFGQVPAFRLQWRVDPDYLRWLGAFLANCTAARFRRNTLAALQLALESQVAMEELASEHDLEFGYRTAGKMHVYRSARAWRAAQEIAAMKAQPGVVQHALSPAEAIAIEPALEAAAGGIVGVLHSPEEAVGDPHAFACAMHDLLVRRWGVTAHFDRRVERLDLSDAAAAVILDNGERLAADIVIDCTGSEGGRLLRAHGHRLPIIPMKGYSFTAPAASGSPLVSITDVGARVVFTRLEGGIRVAGLADLGNADRKIDARRMEILIDTARASLPEGAAYGEATGLWCGLRPMTPDATPRIARPHPRLAYNLGHGMLGWTMAMGSAERLARLILP
ncbi:MAG: amino acid dehydrogenase [Citromicrobium sp.]|nr:amino acid dehydrogenase [Citromicrobium sp.]